MAFGSFDNQITHRGYVTKQMYQISGRNDRRFKAGSTSRLPRRESRVPSGMIPAGTGAQITGQAKTTDTVSMTTSASGSTTEPPPSA